MPLTVTFPSATDPAGHKCVGEAGECQTPSGAQINGTGSKANTAKFPTLPKTGGGGSGKKGGGKNDGKTTPKVPIQKEKSPYSDVTGLESSPVDIYVGGAGSNGIDIYVASSNGLGWEILDPAPPWDNIFFAKKGDSKKGKEGEKTGRNRVLSPLESPVWKGLDSYRGRTKTSGNGKDKRYYEWDYRHGDIEVYDRHRNHLGSMDPITGELYKPEEKGRDLDK